MSAFSPPPAYVPRHRIQPFCKRTIQTPLPRRQAERVAISRSVVIFADYLSDLAVLDAITDISTSTHPTTAITLALFGAGAGVLAADLLTGLAALTVAHLPDGFFDLFGRAHTPRIILTTSDYEHPSRNTPSSTVVTELRSAVEEVTKVRVLTWKRDIFERLLNSCFVTTPPLTVFTGWAADASGDSAIFIEAFFVTMLSLSALAPILRAGGKDCEFIAKLRTWGLLKRRDVGWCQVCGFWDGVLDWGFRRRSTNVTRRRSTNAARRPP